MASSEEYPLVLLFDIGGVCVASPFQAILDYEKSKNIPPGWINFSISASNPKGWWPRLERGEVPLDAAFFSGFRSDLTNAKLWNEFYVRKAANDRAPLEKDKIPGVPDIDAEWLYWEMMRISREVDGDMFPALRRLRKEADEGAKGKRKRRLVLGALSNTSIFPEGHPFTEETSPQGKLQKELREGIFDVFVSSAHVGMRKPDEDIYRYAVTRLHEFVKLKGCGKGVRPKDITFLDDIGGNLRTAKKLGMNTIKVQLGHTDKAVVELEKITGLSLRDEKAKL